MDLEEPKKETPKKPFRELAATITEQDLAEKQVPKKKTSISSKPKAKEKKTRVIKRGKTIELKLEPHPNYNEDITKILEEVGGYEKDMGNSVKVFFSLKKNFLF